MTIEALIIGYLSQKLDVPVYAEEPHNGEHEYVLIEKTGSAKRNHIYEATVAFQSYSTSMLSAAELNETVKGAVEGMIELNSVSRAQLNSDYNYTDTTTKKYRYQAVFDFVFLI